MANRCTTTITITVPTYLNDEAATDQQELYNWIGLFASTPPGTKFELSNGYEMTDVLEVLCPYPNEDWSSPEEIELFEKEPDVWRRRQWGVQFSYDVQVFKDEHQENRFQVVIETPEHPPTFAILNASRGGCALVDTSEWLFSFESGNLYSNRYHYGSCQGGETTGVVYAGNACLTFEDYYGQALFENFDLD